MIIQRKSLSDLSHPERNVRMHTEKQIAEFKRSVEMFGQIRPIVCDEKGVILAGNGLYDTLVAMGCDTADCYVVTGLSTAQKKKLMLADNRIFGLGVDDLDAFDAVLAELGGDLDIPGFDEDMLQSMVAEAEEVSDKLQEYGTLDEDEIDDLKAAQERKEQRIAQAESRGEASTNEEPDNEREQVRRYVVCPSCGAKVWL